MTSQIFISGSVWRCESNSVFLQEMPDIRHYAEIDKKFCPECPVIALDPRGCFQQANDPRDGRLSCDARPPACDPRCSRIDCCGGPQQSFDRKGTLLLFGDGVVVKSADGVRVRRASTGKVAVLSAGDRLSYGDVLEVALSATLVLDNAGREMKYSGAKGACALRDGLWSAGAKGG